MDHDINFDDLMDDDFLKNLDPVNDELDQTKPSWVGDDKSATTYRVWQAICELQKEKETKIKKYNKVTTKTPKSLYQIAKSEVSRQVGLTAQSIFRSSSFSSSLLDYFDHINSELLDCYERQQRKLQKRKNTGIRTKKKEQLVKSYQELEKENIQLKRKIVKDVLDLASERMPFDLRMKLGL
ncbi:hypothetical protein V6957_002542 [Vibrio parahaemolyticus]|uniref:hypothetical protein n=1 Tax=Vibrio harveyi group TaxID=717610 RepID=UPI001DF0DB16|nr:hypothetical protein [Vibrio parahaemolyticus]EGQ8953012.1 hypothetical protein [Vibrio parahaemolyticus]EGQ8987405.1 hypothetical protein [Vibrio parahaemolyticus]EGQ9006601.1 hypothetical protein [Vibrio parahaemolyticus]EGR2895629.1 hypothetical protein [Vibrio parahaemolyticus]EJC6872139.1 hypothetical protein [Vibrio parahaemolyticus]